MLTAGHLYITQRGIEGERALRVERFYLAFTYFTLHVVWMAMRWLHGECYDAYGVWKATWLVGALSGVTGE